VTLAPGAPLQAYSVSSPTTNDVPPYVQLAPGATLAIVTAAPSAPTEPAGPTAPLSPLSPLSPAGPCGPTGPATPCGPARPLDSPTQRPNESMTIFVPIVTLCGVMWPVTLPANIAYGTDAKRTRAIASSSSTVSSSQSSGAASMNAGSSASTAPRSIEKCPSTTSTASMSSRISTHSGSPPDSAA